MIPSHHRLVTVGSLFILCCVCVFTALAGGPHQTRNGLPIKYQTTSPVPFHTDLGPLGAFSNTVATNIVKDGFQAWQDVSTAVISFTYAGQLPVDVDATNDTLYLGKFNDGINPIVFDSDGAIIRRRFGVGTENLIIGYAGSASPTSGSGQISFVEGESVLNGRFTKNFHGDNQGFTEAQFLATFIHEFGHFIGLDHSQINSQFVADGNAANDIYIPTMYPTSTDDDEALASLNPDDIAAVSNLYPSVAYSFTRGSISGTVTRIDGSPVRGANVIAILISDSLMHQYSTVTDYFKKISGEYMIAGLPSGEYWVKIEPIKSSFTGGSSVGPYASNSSDLSFLNPVTPEYYNGAQESGDPATDLPGDRVAITVATGSTVQNIDLIANGQASTPVTSVIEYHGSPAFVFELPSEYDDTKFAVRFTPGATAKLLRTSFLVYTGGIKGSGTLKVTVHQNVSGSLGGVPGAQFSGQVTRSFSTLTAGAYNDVDLEPLNITVTKDVDFHIVFEVVGTAGDTLQFVGDDGSNATTRTSSYFDAGEGPRWYNFADQENWGTGYNLAVRAMINLASEVKEIANEMPWRFELVQNYPNPFNPATTIRYSISESGPVRLRVFDFLGREVKTLVQREQPPGSYQVQWNGTDAHERPVASGAYYYRLESGASVETRKMVLVK
jgi:hypothetical protein